MFDVAPTELLLVVVVALVVIGPKDLPKAMRFVGKWVGKARGMARHFRAGLDTMMREAELEELEKQWRAQNEAIMREFPNIDGVDAPTMLPATTLPPEAKRDDAGAGPDSPGPDSSAPENPDHAAATTKPETPRETHEVPPPGGPLP